MKNKSYCSFPVVSCAIVITVSLIGPLAIAEHMDGNGLVGGVVVIPLAREATTVSFQDKPQLIVARNAIIGIPLGTKVGYHQVVVNYANGDIVFLGVMVEDKQYPEERITIKDDKFVTPPPLDLERIRRESQLMRDVYGLFTEHPTSITRFVMPLQGRISGVFGSRRFFNDQPRNPHSGMDLAASTGTPIKSPAAGSVSLTGDFFFNGNTVMLNHGGGLVSMMCHLDEIHVKQGEQVKEGDILGTVGATGRATGPHLHWSISLSGDRIDPQDFIPKFNALFDDE